MHSAIALSDDTEADSIRSEWPEISSVRVSPDPRVGRASYEISVRTRTTGGVSAGVLSAGAMHGA